MVENEIESKIIHVFLLFLLILYIQIRGTAQNQQILFEHLGVEEGISTASITCVYQDSKGFLWIGGYGGLIRYDGYDAIAFYHDPEDSLSIGDNRITCVIEDQKENLWVGTQRGVNYFNRKTEAFTRLHDPKNEASITNNYVNALCKDKSGKIWIGTTLGLNLFDPQLNSYIDLPNGYEVFGKNEVPINVIYEDKKCNIWIGSNLGLKYFHSEDKKFYDVSFKNAKDYSRDLSITGIEEDNKGCLWLASTLGLFHYDPQSGFLNHFSLSEKEAVWSKKYINTIFMDRKGLLWCGTASGLVQFNPTDKTFNRFENDPYNTTSISSQNIECITEDQSGIIWIGTIKGLNYFRPSTEKFRRFSTSLINQIVAVSQLRSFHEISPGKLLMWENDGLKILDWKKGTITPFPYRPPQYMDTWNTGVNCFFEDDKKKLWMGTNGGVFIFDPSQKTFSHLKQDPLSPFSLSSSFIRDIFQDHTGDIWIATWDNGVNRFCDQSGHITAFLNTKEDEKNFNYATRNIFEDRSGTLWVGTRGGLNKFVREENRFIRYHDDPGNPASISENTAFDLYEDKDGFLWIGTYGGGLNKFDPGTETFSNYTIKDGLPDNNIFSVLPDRHGNLWLSTYKGIVKFDPVKESFRNFDYRDGLLNKGYDAFSYYQSPYSGELIFGGSEGIDIFHPDSIQTDSTLPKVVLTDFLLFNQSVSIKRPTKQPSDDNFLLSQSITETKELRLPYKMKVLTFKFAAIHFANPDKNQYAYMLEGFNREWQHIGSQRIVTFTNLSPGKYRFRVKASNSDGIWHTPDTALSLIIKPPWWQIWWAYLLYILVIVLSFYGFFSYQRKRWQLKAELELGRKEADQLKELDRIKTRLYTNITHEFRTPLTVISGMIDQINNEPQKWLKQGSQMIKRNSRHLLNLVNEMLDLQKLETGMMELNIVQNNVVEYLAYLSESFNSFADSKDIDFHFHACDEEIIMDYDPEKIQAVVSNLLSNAIKFTPLKGKVTIHVDKQLIDGNDKLFLKVKDTGKGIPEDQQTHIFDRFYQVDDSSTRRGEGTGIGLALTYELVKLMNGIIQVESSLGKGSTFSIFIPISRGAPLKKPLLFGEASLEKSPIAKTQKEKIYKARTDLPALLIVEDNPDVVQYLISCLEEDYQLLVANNGKVGIEKAIEHVPDIIISDVMMPEKDGFELCETLKNDERTSHIPIVLLTAKATFNDRIEGLQHGADAYLVKPFNKKELFTRLEKLLELRKNLRRYFSESKILTGDQNIQQPQRYSKESAFLKKVNHIILQHIDDDNFKSEALQQAVQMGRTQLYNKLKALTGYSTANYMNFIRLQKAQQFLKTTDLNISEIAYQSGFTDPNYFSRKYAEKFGYPPSRERK